MSNSITNEIAYRLRYERGLQLPTYREYADSRMKVIADRMADLYEELADLDTEILDIYKGRS